MGDLLRREWSQDRAARRTKRTESKPQQVGADMRDRYHVDTLACPRLRSVRRSVRARCIPDAA